MKHQSDGNLELILLLIINLIEIWMIIVVADLIWLGIEQQYMVQQHNELLMQHLIEATSLII